MRTIAESKEKSIRDLNREVESLTNREKRLREEN